VVVCLGSKGGSMGEEQPHASPAWTENSTLVALGCGFLTQQLMMCPLCGLLDNLLLPFPLIVVSCMC